MWLSFHEKGGTGLIPGPFFPQGSDKETVDSMQRNEERLRTVLQGSSLGFMEANSKLQITNVNAAVCV